jgi:hypothetical protein
MHIAHRWTRLLHKVSLKPVCCSKHRATKNSRFGMRIEKMASFPGSVSDSNTINIGPRVLSLVILSRHTPNTSKGLFLILIFFQHTVYVEHSPTNRRFLFDHNTPLHHRYPIVYISDSAFGPALSVLKEVVMEYHACVYHNWWNILPRDLEMVFLCLFCGFYFWLVGADKGVF